MRYLPCRSFSSQQLRLEGLGTKIPREKGYGVDDQQTVHRDNAVARQPWPWRTISETAVAALRIAAATAALYGAMKGSGLL